MTIYWVWRIVLIEIELELTMNLRSALVLFKDTAAGSLEETAGGGSRFAYNADWHSSIACCFPVERREYEWSSGVHPFFQHLGSEGWLRGQQARSGHIEQEDDFGFLLGFGADCIGAVSIKNTTPLANAEPITEMLTNPGRTISGVQRKLLVVKKEKEFCPAGSAGPAPYIAKFNSEEIPTLVRNEYLSLRWTTAVLGAREVTVFTLGQVAALNETALIVTRFDRTETGEKLRLEDFAQILCKPRGRDYSGKYNASYEDIADAIKHYSVRPEIDLARFFRRLVVFALIGNNDAHLKNFSLLETPEGLRLSPVYDVVNAVMYANKGYDQQLALSIDGKKVPFEGVTRSLLSNFGRSIGLPERAVGEIFSDLKNRVHKSTLILEPPAAEGPEGFVTQFNEIVSGACLRILEE